MDSFRQGKIREVKKIKTFSEQASLSEGVRLRNEIRIVGDERQTIPLRLGIEIVEVQAVKGFVDIVGDAMDNRPKVFFMFEASTEEVVKLAGALTFSVTETKKLINVKDFSLETVEKRIVMVWDIVVEPKCLGILVNTIWKSDKTKDLVDPIN
jgi:hypothetical protein